MFHGNVESITKNHLNFIVEKGQKKHYKSWIGDSFSFLYDYIMKSSIFPKKFGADINKHYEILTQELRSIHGKRILELATGSGSAANFLPSDNMYTGTDISPGLLRQAVKNFNAAGFSNADFYVASADDLPLVENSFSICLCILSFNFFTDITKVFQEIIRVLIPGGIYLCCVPVPERNILQSSIRGMLFSEEELAMMCTEHGFRFESLPVNNGALLYFRAVLQQ